MTTKPKAVHQAPDLFEAVANRPQWHQLPQPIKAEILQLLIEMLTSAAARQLIQQMQKGKTNE